MKRTSKLIAMINIWIKFNISWLKVLFNRDHSNYNKSTYPYWDGNSENKKDISNIIGMS